MMKRKGINREAVMAEAIRGMGYVDRFLKEEDEISAEDAARALAKGYAGLCFLQGQYKERFSEERHYTRDDAYYLLTQGAHEETERVQTSGPSDGVARAVANVDRFLVRLNREADEEFHDSVVEPYMRISELKRLFEFSLKLLDSWLAKVAMERYGNKAAVSRIKDFSGKPMTAGMMKKAEGTIIKNLASVLSNYKARCASDGMGIRDRYAAEVITATMPDHIAKKVQDYMAAQDTEAE